MSDRARVIATATALVVGAAACRSAGISTARPSAPPALPPSVAAPVMTSTAQNTAQPVADEDTAHEQHVTIDTYGRDMDVKQVLDFLARQGHVSLVYSPDIQQKVRLQLNDVPVSVALQTVLTMANLTLQSTTEPPKAPGSTSVVFYELPVNVDSLGVDAIMKRFGVGRGIAELIVKSRVERP